jgi:hypothetical protein
MLETDCFTTKKRAISSFYTKSLFFFQVFNAFSRLAKFDLDKGGVLKRKDFRCAWARREVFLFFSPRARALPLLKTKKPLTMVKGFSFLSGWLLTKRSALVSIETIFPMGKFVSTDS